MTEGTCVTHRAITYLEAAELAAAAADDEEARQFIADLLDAEHEKFLRCDDFPIWGCPRCVDAGLLAQAEERIAQSFEESEQEWEAATP